MRSNIDANIRNENRKNAIKEVQYLTAFKADLEANRDELERVMFLSKATRASADSILKKAVREIDHIDVRRINEFLLRATAYTI